MGSPVAFTADDGAVALRGCYHAPQGTVKAVVLIAGAMGVKQDYYAAFSQWLAVQGYASLSFDYRGMGESLPAGRSLRGFDADLFDWSRDIDAAIDTLLARHPEAPLFVVGHSLGCGWSNCCRDSEVARPQARRPRKIASPFTGATHAQQRGHSA